jgi:hypothetical protein
MMMKSSTSFEGFKKAMMNSNTADKKQSLEDSYTSTNPPFAAKSVYDLEKPAQARGSVVVGRHTKNQKSQNNSLSYNDR